MSNGVDPLNACQRYISYGLSWRGRQRKHPAPIGTPGELWRRLDETDRAALANLRSDHFHNLRSETVKAFLWENEDPMETLFRRIARRS